MQRFVGEVAIVTGAGNGIGAASAKRLAAEGATVIIADRDDRAAQQTADAASRLKGNCIGCDTAGRET